MGGVRRTLTRDPARPRPFTRAPAFLIARETENLGYGQDPGGKKRDGEIHLAASISSGQAFPGLDLRLRLAVRPRHGFGATEPKARHKGRSVDPFLTLAQRETW
jgi:hypothetical protein